MITLSKLAPNVHQAQIEGSIRSSDMQELVALAEEIGNGSSKPSLVFDIGEVDDLDWSALAEETSHLSALMRMLRRLDRIAVIANQGWLRTGARIESALLPGVTYEVFSREKAEQARLWAKGETDRPHADAVRLVDVGDNSIVAFECDGRIDAQNAETVIEDMKRTLNDTGARRMLARIRNWHGFDPTLLASTNLAKSKMEFIKRLDRYAIVGGPEWMGSLAETIAPATGIEIKAFELDNESSATEWLRHG